jgi:hypothetical protein
MLKRKRSDSTIGLTRQNRLNRTENTKRRKVQTFYRQTLSSNNTLTRIRENIGPRAYHLVFSSDSASAFSNNPFSGNIGFNRHPENSYYLITVENYSRGLHVNHAISAIRRGDKLFVFDPWGRDRKPATYMAAVQLAHKLGIYHVFIYNGRNLQYYDCAGVCVGFASDFLTKFRNKPLISRTFNKDVSQAFRANANNTSVMERALMRRETPGPNSIIPRRT